jgi:hypothetical protein
MESLTYRHTVVCCKTNKKTSFLLLSGKLICCRDVFGLYTYMFYQHFNTLYLEADTLMITIRKAAVIQNKVPDQVHRQ